MSAGRRLVACALLPLTLGLFTACAPPAVAPAPVVSSAPPAPTAAPSASAAAEAPPGPTLPQRAAEDLRRLPPGAAYTFVYRAREYHATVSQTDPSDTDDLAALGLWNSGVSVEALAEEAGLDARGALLGAVLPASASGTGAVVDGLVAGLPDKAVARLRAEHAGEATRMRVLLPLLAGNDAGNAAMVLARHLADTGAIEACPGGAHCTGFGAGAQLVLALDPRRAAAIYVDGQDLRVDVVAPLFVPGTDAAALAALQRMRDEKGGSLGRCSQLSPNAVAAICYDPAAMGELGAAIDHASIVAAFSKGAVGKNGKPQSMAERKKNAAKLRDSARQNLVLGTLPRMLASDGTAVAGSKGKGNASSWLSWALADEARPGLEKAFASERCAVGTGLTGDLLPALSAAVGGPPPEVGDPSKLVASAFAAGDQATALVFSGPWLNMVGLMSTDVGRLLMQNAKVPKGKQFCFYTEGGRLVMEARPAP